MKILIAATLLFWVAVYGYATVVSGPTFTLAPGETRTFTLEITSPLDAVEGSYDIPITVTGDGRSGSTSATYVVSGAVANMPPVALDDTVTTDKSTPVTIDVLANDYDPDGDTLHVLLVENPNKGTVSQNNDDSLTYTPGRKARGSDSFGYTITDGHATASATVWITFTKTKSSKGKGPNK